MKKTETEKSERTCKGVARKPKTTKPEQTRVESGQAFNGCNKKCEACMETRCPEELP